MAYHLPALRALATRGANAVELGVKRGASTTALLLGCRKVISYDIVETKQARELEKLAGESWSYRIQDSRTAEPTVADLLFIDSLHTYDQVKAELAQHGDSVRRYIAFHDTITFGSVGAEGETGRHSMGTLGIRPAIDEWMIRNPHWHIMSHDVHSHGLLVLRRWNG